MAMETKTSLNAVTIDKLQQLIRINIDSEDGFNQAAENIEDLTVASTFRELGAQRAQMATELQDYVSFNGEKPRDEGSYAAAFHRTLIDLRSMFSGGDTHAILSEAERGEDSIKAAYEDALKSTAGSPMNDVLTRQYAAVKAGHDRIRDLRDAYASS